MAGKLELLIRSAKMLCIVQIKLPETQDPEAFATFMNEEYFPAIGKDATRIGKVSGLRLFQGDTTDTVRQFYWHVCVSKKPAVDDQTIERKFEAFGAEVHDLGEFVEAAEWPNKE